MAIDVAWPKIGERKQDIHDETEGRIHQRQEHGAANHHNPHADPLLGHSGDRIQQ